MDSVHERTRLFAGTARSVSRFLLVLVCLCLPVSAFGAFGYTDNGTAYVVDTGAGLVFQVRKTDGSIISIVFNGTEYKATSGKFSQIASGLGTPTTVTPSTDGSSYVMMKIQTGPDNPVVSSLTQYLVVRNGVNTIYMATYATAEPNVGELRWITRLNSALISNGPIPSDTRGSTGPVESKDVFGMPDGTTRSKYYGDHITHGKERAMDLTYCGATGPGIGCWMVFGNRESSSGGPFFRDIENQDGGDQEIYNYMNSGHNQTEARRLNVLYGPYALVFTTGAPPTLPMDFSWMGNLGLTGWVPASGRGTVSGTTTGIPSGFQGVVGFANSTAQYWAKTDSSGNYTSSGMKPGTYTATLYKGELAVATSSVTVNAGSTTTLNLTSTEPKPSVIFRIGAWDGTPAGLLNADKITQMHPSDVRMSPWNVTTYTVGVDDPSTFPAIQFRGKNSPTTIKFNLAANQVVDLTLRIGITCAYNGGRPQITVNNWTSGIPASSDQPKSRSFTIGTYRGNNATFTYTIPASALVIGTNTLKINPVSGSTDLSAWLSAGWVYDAVELDGPIAIPTITYVGSDPLEIRGTSEPFRNIAVTIDGSTAAGTAIASADGHWTVNYTGSLSAGIHGFTAVASDDNGHSSTPSSAFTVDTSVTTPSITSATGDGSSFTSGSTTSVRTFSFSGTAGAGATVQLTRVGTGVIGTVAADGSGHWTVDYTGVALPEGANDFYATTTGGANDSPSSAIFTLNIQGTPRITIQRENPAMEVIPNTVGSVVFKVTFNDTVSGVTTGAFGVTTSGGVTGTVASISAASGNSFDVTVNSISGTGTLSLDLLPSNGITDSSGNPEPEYHAGESYSLVVPTTGNGTWERATSGGLWSDPLNWAGAVIADGSASSANFSALDITADNTVHLDSARTLKSLVFGDTDKTSAASWTIDNNGSAANTLTLAGTSPTITVNELGTGATATIGASLAGDGGLAKEGVGTLALTAPNSLTGQLDVNAGDLQIGSNGSMDVGNNPVNLQLNTQIDVDGGSFSTAGLVSAVTGAFVVNNGEVTLGNFRTNSDFSGTLRVNGGSLNVGDVNIQRNGGRTPDFSSGFIVTGGVTNADTIGLGTKNSFGALSVEGGSLQVSGPITVGNQVTSGRGGAIRVTGGTFVSSDSGYGIILAKTHGSNANNVASAEFAGGTSTVEKFTLGYDSTVTAGSTSITVDGGALYIGAGGIVKDGASGLATNLQFRSGILGARTDWSSDLDASLPSGGNVSIKAADSLDIPHTITLNGVLSGSGGFTKTGAGNLILTGADTFGGPVDVMAGALELNGSFASGDAVTVDSGGTLTGIGTIGRAVLMNSGGNIDPGGSSSGSTLTTGSLTWNGGGALTENLSTGNVLTITGAMTKGTAGTYEFQLTAGGTLGVGTTHTLVTFGSSDFQAKDFSYSGLNGYLGVFLKKSDQLDFLITGAGATAEYTNWAYVSGLPADKRGPEDNPSGDGIPNLLKFALGLDPLQTTGQGIVATTVTVDGKVYPAIEFTRRQNLGGVTTNVIVSPTLQFATDLGSSEVSATPTGNGLDDVVVRSTVPLSVTPKQYFHITATLPQN